MKMNENCSIDPKAIEAMMRLRAEKEICTYVHDGLAKEYGQAPCVEELIKYFNGKPVVLPGFTTEQKFCAIALLAKFNLLQTHVMRELLMAKATAKGEVRMTEDAYCEEEGDDDMADDNEE